MNVQTEKTVARFKINIKYSCDVVNKVRKSWFAGNHRTINFDFKFTRVKVEGWKEKRRLIFVEIELLLIPVSSTEKDRFVRL